jgi:hypothetical protein
VLIPVPAAPTLDPHPIASAELDALTAQTEPKIFKYTAGGDDSACGCPFVAGGSSNKASDVTPDGSDGGIRVSQPVAIGPVTAVVLGGGSGDEVNAWLAQNNFAIPDANRPLVTAYAGPERYFIALRRTEGVSPGVATSVGVHFSLPGDQRGLPLRFARLGAAPTVAFTVFVVADTGVGPGIPFDLVTLNDLDAGILRTAGYSAAVSGAVSRRNNQAFVVEGTWAGTELTAALGSSLQLLLGPGQHLTRLSTILPAAALVTDVTFSEVLKSTPPSSRFVIEEGPRGAPGSRARMGRVLGLALLAMAAVRGRRRSKKEERG